MSTADTPDTPATLALLAPYVPSTLLRALAGPRPPDRIARFRAATLVLDIAGFTPIAVSLSSAGPRGIDALRRLLGEYYADILDVIEAHGGIVYQFAGDSILTCFEPEEGEGDDGIAHRAGACALQIQARLRRFASVELMGQTCGVQSRIGLGLGDCHRLLMGSEATWLHPVLVGPSLEAAVVGEKRAQAGEVFASAELWEKLPEGKEGEPWSGSFRLRSVPPVKDGAPRAPAALDPALAARAAQFLPPALFTKVTTGHQEFIGDFRDVTCLFIRCGGLDLQRDLEAAGRNLGELYELLQQEATDYGGTLLQTDFTDKGNVFFVLFGAPTAQENKELLATRLAAKLLEARRRFPSISQLQAAVATGHAYCGNVGSTRRKGYTALGEVVNLASRLLTHRTGEGILIDAATERKVRQEISTVLLEHASMKGIDHPVPIHEVKPEKEQQQQRGLKMVATPGEVIGRLDELRALEEAADQAFREGGRICLLSGEAGLGKSRLSAWLVDKVSSARAQILYGACFSYEAYTPFFPWKEVLKDLFQVLDWDPPAVQLEKVRAELAQIEGLGPEWLPVVAGVIGLEVEEEAPTRGLDARRKNEMVFEIIFELLRQRTLHGPLLLVFEDIHWADRLSLDLVDYLGARIQSLPMLLLVVSRPDPRMELVLGIPRCTAIELTQMSPEDARSLLRVRLDLEVPNPALEELILGKAQGNPFFVESIVHSLAEEGYLVAGEGGRRKLTRGLSEISIPDSVQGAVLARIDRLPAMDQMVLKVASVIGRVFTLEALRVLLPESFSMDDLEETIYDLSTFGLIVLEVDEPVTCGFTHVVIRDVAYNTLLISNREDLHRRLARHLEAKAARNLADSAGLLAFHFLAGNEEQKGLEYSLLAARSAGARYANREALHHYERSIEILQKVHATRGEERAEALRQARRERAQTVLQAGSYVESIRLFEECLAEAPARSERVEIHVGLGRAYQEKGESSRAIQELERALNLLGRRTPRSLPEIYLRVLGLLLLRGLQALFPWLAARVRESRLADYLKQLSTLISLIKIYYFVDMNKLIWAVLQARHMADRSRSEHGRGLAAGYVGALMFGAGLLRPARRACERALDLARRAQDLLAEGVARSRLATTATFANELAPAIPIHQEAVRLLRHVGDVWETQTSLMLLATTHFLRSELEIAEKLYTEMGLLGQQVNALMHQAWALSWAPYCRYLLGTEPAPDVMEELEQGLAVSRQVDDLANQCAALNHMAVVAVREGDVEGAAKLSARCFGAIWRYQVLVPFLQIGLVDAAEAALFALENGARSVPRAKLLRIVRLGCAKARLIGRVYPYLRGPALRVAARALALRRGPAAAAPVFDRAIGVLEASPNRLELGAALLDAAVALPSRREELAARARQVLESTGARAELRRLDLLASQAGPARHSG